MKSKSIRTKILVVSLPVIIGIMILLTIISIVSSQKTVNSEIDNKMFSQLNQTEEEIRNSLYKHSKITESLARTVENLGENLTNDQYEDLIKNLIKTNDETFGGGVFYEPYKFNANQKFFGAYSYKENGKLVSTDDYSKDDSNYNEEDWYTIGKNTKDPVVWSDVYVDNVTNKTM